MNYQSPGNLHSEQINTDQRTDISGAKVELDSVILAVLEAILVSDRSLEIS